MQILDGSVEVVETYQANNLSEDICSNESLISSIKGSKSGKEIFDSSHRPYHCLHKYLQTNDSVHFDFNFKLENVFK